jgi:hypothetical protein
MSKISVFLVCFWSATFVGAAEWRPQDRLLDAICQIESGGGVFVYGDRGLSLGNFQFQKAAWSDVSEWRKKQNSPIYTYQQNVLDAGISRLYAADYLTIIYHRLQKQYEREPLATELYAAYNMGMGNFRKCNYDLARINKTTAEKCRQLAEMLK